MKARIFWWITILFFVVSTARSSSVLEGSSNSVCYKNVSRKQYRPMSYRDVHDERHWIFWTKKVSIPRIKFEERTVWMMEPTCCPGYENKTGICKCNYYWGGEFCHEPLFCTIALQFHVNVSEPVTEPPLEFGIAEDTIVNPPIGRNRLPECPPKCLDEVGSKFFNTTRSGNTTYYFVPIDSSCKTIADHLNFWKTYCYVIMAGGIGIIIMVAMVVCILCIVQKKRKRMNTIDHELLEPEYDYVEVKRI